jgi:hypothetical protein
VYNHATPQGRKEKRQKWVIGTLYKLSLARVKNHTYSTAGTFLRRVYCSRSTINNF